MITPIPLLSFTLIYIVTERAIVPGLFKRMNEESACIYPIATGKEAKRPKEKRKCVCAARTSSVRGMRSDDGCNPSYIFQAYEDTKSIF